MDDFDRQLIENNPGWKQVLETYLEATAEPTSFPAEEKGAVRWADRLVSLEGLAPEELSLIHGRLIALGWLKFQFEIGQSGLTYRVSSEGRAVLRRLNGQSVIVEGEGDEEAAA